MKEQKVASLTSHTPETSPDEMRETLLEVVGDDAKTPTVQIYADILVRLGYDRVNEFISEQMKAREVDRNNQNIFRLRDVIYKEDGYLISEEGCGCRLRGIISDVLSLRGVDNDGKPREPECWEDIFNVIAIARQGSTLDETEDENPRKKEIRLMIEIMDVKSGELNAWETLYGAGQVYETKVREAKVYEDSANFLRHQGVMLLNAARFSLSTLNSELGYSTSEKENKA